YPDAFEDFRVCASYDGHDWFRLPTSNNDGRVEIVHETPRGPAAFYALFPPYPSARRRDVLAKCERSTRARVEVLGPSTQGRDVTLIALGAPDEARPKIGSPARQHSGETMAEWFAEGLVTALLERQSELAEALLDRATVYVVPCVNVDGAALGNLRANALGVD